MTGDTTPPEMYADQSEDDAHDVDCAMHAAEAGNAGSWPIVADVLRLEVLRLRGLLCSSPVVQPEQDEDGSSLRSSKPSAAGPQWAVLRKEDGVIFANEDTARSVLWMRLDENVASVFGLYEIREVDGG